MPAPNKHFGRFFRPPAHKHLLAIEKASSALAWQPFCARKPLAASACTSSLRLEKCCYTAYPSPPMPACRFATTHPQLQRGYSKAACLHLPAHATSCPARPSPKSQVPSPKSQVPSPKSQVPSPKSQAASALHAPPFSACAESLRGREKRGLTRFGIGLQDAKHRHSRAMASICNATANRPICLIARRAAPLNQLLTGR